MVSRKNIEKAYKELDNWHFGEPEEEWGISDIINKAMRYGGAIVYGEIAENFDNKLQMMFYWDGEHTEPDSVRIDFSPFIDSNLIANKPLTEAIIECASSENNEVREKFFQYIRQAVDEAETVLSSDDTHTAT